MPISTYQILRWPAFALLLGISVSSQARQLSAAEALKRVDTDIRTESSDKLLKSVSGAAVVSTGPAVAGDGTVAYYVFESQTQPGYFIASGDDRLRPLLAVVDSGSFEADNMSPAMQWWLQQYTEQAKSAVQSADIQSRSTGGDLADLYSKWVAVDPLLTTRWNQYEPYWNDCPISNGKRCLTGCTATALAQIIYHNRFFQGSGTHTYTSTGIGQTLSYKFEGHTFDWDNMLDDYADKSVTPTAAQNAAVADLMYACGVVSDMGYGTDASGATVKPDRMIRMFGLDPTTAMLNRSSYSTPEWESLIYDELSHGRPVYYSGFTPSAGHAFVCDGYDDPGLFHINWGWGGAGDGYFALTALYNGGPESFDSGFCGSQAIVRIVPPTATSKPEPLPDLIPKCSEYNITSIYDYSWSFSMDRSPYEVTQVKPGMLFTSVDDPSVSVFVPIWSAMWSFDYNIGYIWTFTNYQLVFDGLTIAPGRYTIDPAIRILNQDADHTPIKLTSGAQFQAYANVKSMSNISIERETRDDAYKLEFTTASIGSDIYRNSSFPIDITVVNTGKSDYTGRLSYALRKVNTGVSSYEIGASDLTIPAGDSYTLRTNVTIANLQNAADLLAGDYRFIINTRSGLYLYGSNDNITLHDGEASGGGDNGHLDRFYIAGMTYGSTSNLVDSKLENGGFPTELPQDAPLFFQPWEMSTAAGSYNYNLCLYRKGETEPCYKSPSVWSVNIGTPGYYFGQVKAITGLPSGEFRARFVNSDGTPLSSAWDLTIYRELDLDNSTTIRLIDSADGITNALGIMRHAGSLAITSEAVGGNADTQIALVDRFADRDIDLQNVILSDKVTSIGLAAFRFCHNLQSVVMRSPEVPFRYPEAVFYGVGSDVNFYVPAASYQAYSSALASIGNVYSAIDAIPVNTDPVTVEAGETVELPVEFADNDNTDLECFLSEPSVARVTYAGGKLTIEGLAVGRSTLIIRHPQPDVEPVSLSLSVAEPAGIDSVDFDKLDPSTVEIYTTSGVRIGKGADARASLAPGVYILRSGSKSTKIIVR